MTPSRRKPPTEPLILVVDDNLDAREMYCAYLRFDGFRCIEARDGVEALALAREHRPQLVLMDATMPGMDGWQATAEIRADPSLFGIAVVMLTAHAFDEHRRRAQAVGADAFLAKPVLPDELARAVRQLLRIP
jgi:two-component system cell cycle response regulator DivK